MSPQTAPVKEPTEAAFPEIVIRGQETRGSKRRRIRGRSLTNEEALAIRGEPAPYPKCSIGLISFSASAEDIIETEETRAMIERCREVLSSPSHVFPDSVAHSKTLIQLKAHIAQQEALILVYLANRDSSIEVFKTMGGRIFIPAENGMEVGSSQNSAEADSSKVTHVSEDTIMED